MDRLFLILAILLSFSALAFIVETRLVEAIDVQTVVIVSICGDGLMSGPEVCDEGPGGNLGTYASTTADRVCGTSCMTFGPYCGDTTLQVRFDEECDDGNHTDGDLCSATCQSETAVPQGGSGTPTVGSTPSIPGATPGVIPSQTETKVVLRGKAYPNSDVNVLLDGKRIGTVRADSSANFIYTATDITAGTATFGFWARDREGIESITTSIVFEVVQSAVTTVAHIFFPPTIKVCANQVDPGDLVTLSGNTIPIAKVVTELSPGKTKFESTSEATGSWAIQLDTASIDNGLHAVKAYFEQNSSVRSGYGKSVSFTVGDVGPRGGATPDMNKDGKVNLVDFSIFLLSWNSDDPLADFNADGAANLADFSIMLFEWTG